MENIPNIQAMMLERLDRIETLFLNYINSKKDSNGVDMEEYLTVPKTAEFLNCSKIHVYSLKGRIPHVLRGARLYFKKSDLVDYMERGRTEPDKRMARNRRK